MSGNDTLKAITFSSHDLAHSVEFQMSLLLFTALGGYLFSSRIRQPAVVGVILSGVLIGPFGLGLIRYSDFVASIAHIGAIILLFVIGFEFSIKVFFNLSYFLIALIGTIVPWVAGYALATLFGYEFMVAIIIGVALTATSIAITADTLRDMGKLQSDAAQTIIGAAIIDDILALLALAISQQISGGALDPLPVAFFAVKAILFLAAGIWFGRKILTPVIGKLDRSPIACQHPDFVFIMTMMTAFLYAMAAEMMSLSAIIGSFLAGVSLKHAKTDISLDFKECAEHLRIIFGAAFFVSLGVLADFQTFTWNEITFTLALTVVAVISKVAGCGLIARLGGMSTRDSLIIGFGMSPRGEVAMTIALLALLNNSIDQAIFVAIVLMSLLTSIITPLVLRNWLYTEEKRNHQMKSPAKQKRAK